MSDYMNWRDEVAEWRGLGFTSLACDKYAEAMQTIDQRNEQVAKLQDRLAEALRTALANRNMYENLRLYTRHLEWCGEFAQDGITNCRDGYSLQQAAGMTLFEK